MENPPFPDLFQEAQALFKEMVHELASYGIEVNPNLELRRVVAILSYYDLDDGNIYLGLPDPNTPVGKLMWLVGRSLSFCENDEELTRHLRLFVPHLLAHELGHHVRHRYGLFSDDKWHEEQVANQLAMAIMNRRLSHDDRREAIRIVRRALDGASGAKGQLVAAATYHDLLGALNVDGKVSDSMVIKVEVMKDAFALSPEEMLKGGAFPTEDMVKVLARRGEAIDQINSEYVSDQMKYMNYHTGWLYYDLTNRQTATIDEFARTHLGLREELLAPPQAIEDPSSDAIRACYQAYVDCGAKSATAARYFYKRYRSLLIGRLQAAEIGPQGNAAHLEGWIESLLESWSDDKTDTLDLLTQITPSNLQELLPHRIGQTQDRALPLETHLPTHTDARVWTHAALGAPDQAVENTLARLKLLDQSNVFGYLPAEVLLRIAGDLSRVHLREGDTMVWQGDLNSDIYLAVEGELSVLATLNGRLRQIGLLRAGDIFGEMAFFTGEPRSATVRAKTAAQCFVLKASDLQAMVYQHPIILMQMARSLAKRLEAASAWQKALS